MSVDRQFVKQCMMRALRNPAWIAFTWFGMTAGISLLATPARFAAATASRPAVLDVSRTVFAALNKAEFVALIILLIVVRVGDRAKNLWVPCGLLALILIAQSAWLLPELSVRTDQVIAGIEPASSIAHGAYSVLELVKLLTLVFVGFQSLQRLASTRNTKEAG